MNHKIRQTLSRWGRNPWAGYDSWKTSPPENQGFYCYCPGCEKRHHTDDVDDETWLIYCECGEDFKPEE